jgi:hypothetical protein
MSEIALCISKHLLRAADFINQNSNLNLLKLSKVTKSYQNLSKFIKIYQNLPKFIKIHQYLSKFTKIYLKNVYDTDTAIKKLECWFTDKFFLVALLFASLAGTSPCEAPYYGQWDTCLSRKH